MSFFSKVLQSSILLIFLSIQVKAQSYKHHPVSSFVNKLKAIHVADLDNDQKVDIISGSTEDEDNFSWYKNMGNGVFSTQKVISTTQVRPTAVYAADIDQDGIVDVVSGSSSDGKLAWYKNLGGGQFSSQNLITDSLYGIDYVRVVDIDNDGDLDILTQSGTPETNVIWYENDGSGQFNNAVLVYSKIENIIIDVADIDGDTDIDIVMSIDSWKDIVWYENDSTGIFTNSHTITTYFPHVTSLHCYDMNGDGDIDVLASNGEGSTVSDQVLWYENLGNNSFSTYKTVDLNAYKVSNAIASDMDGDGDIDVMAQSYKSNQLLYYENTGSNNYAAKDTIQDYTKSPSLNILVDLDGDLDLDMLTGFSTLNREDEIAWVENLGSGNFSTINHIVSSTRGATSVDSKDLDGDGLLDILSASYADNKVAWYRNLGNGDFSAIKIISEDVNYTYCVHANDLDGDGDMDVLSASGGDSKIAWYENLGGGQFSAQNIINSNASGARFVTTGDIDGDGDLDVLSASRSNDNIDWYENLGNGNFSSNKIINNWADGARAVYPADLDLDGDLDVIYAAWDDDEVAWHENLGNKTFSAKKNIGININSACDVYAADIDLDGDLDVLAAGAKGMYWFENIDSASSFITKNLSGSSSSSGPLAQIHASDLDLDGDLDILSATTGSNHIGFYENLDSGLFAYKQYIYQSYDGSSVFTSDIDNDGDPDVISAAYSGHQVMWHENLILTHHEYKVTFCDTGTYITPSGKLINQSGTYYDTIANAHGGDSIMTIHVRLNGTDTIINNVDMCLGDTLFVGNSIYTSTGMYEDSLTNIYGCDSVVTTNLKVTYVDTSLVWNNHMLEVINTAPGMTYQWISCTSGLPITGETNKMFTPTANGNYAVVISFQGCSKISGCWLLANIGLPEVNDLNLELYPNPTDGLVNITWSANLGDFSVLVSDLNGKTLFKKAFANKPEVSLDLSTLKAGMYLIEIIYSKGRVVKQVIIE